MLCPIIIIMLYYIIFLCSRLFQPSVLWPNKKPPLPACTSSLKLLPFSSTLSCLFLHQLLNPPPGLPDWGIFPPAGENLAPIWQPCPPRQAFRNSQWTRSSRKNVVFKVKAARWIGDWSSTNGKYTLTFCRFDNTLRLKWYTECNVWISKSKYWLFLIND